MQNLTTNTHYSLVVSSHTDNALRRFLASQGGLSSLQVSMGLMSCTPEIQSKSLVFRVAKGKL